MPGYFIALGIVLLFLFLISAIFSASETVLLPQVGQKLMKIFLILFEEKSKFLNIMTIMKKLWQSF